MKIENEILDKLKSSLKYLIPQKGCAVHLDLAPIPGNPEIPGCIALVEYETLKFSLLIDVLAQNSMPALKNKISRLKSIVTTYRDAVPVLVARYFSPQRQAICRDEGVYFIDLSGNAFIEYKSFYLERIGFKNQFPEKREGRDPFSDKATLVLRSVLTGGQRLWGVREIAQKTGLSPGYVSRMAKELEKLKYITRINSKVKLRSPKDVLDDWVRSYSLKKNKMFRYFCMAANPDEIFDKLRRIKIPDTVKYGLSVQAGANLVLPYSVFREVHLYAHNENDIVFLKKNLELNEAEQGANLVIMLPYYINSVFYDTRIIQGLRVVSDIQLYIDLYNYPIRGLEQAEHLYDKRLHKIFTEAGAE